MDININIHPDPAEFEASLEPPEVLYLRTPGEYGGVTVFVPDLATAKALEAAGKALVEHFEKKLIDA